jgi:hypothetical protein
LRLALQSPDTAPVVAVRAAVEQDSIEVFGSTVGKVRIRDLQQLDIDRDGVPEVFVRIEPSFRQTPTILVYAYTATTGAHRLVQALVPGRLRRLSGQLQDSHTLGRAVDMTVGQGEPFDTAKFIGIAIERHMSLVGYRGFFHADMRDGFVSYVDLFDRPFPTADSVTCNNFEFSRIDGMLAGTLAGDKVNRYLVALTDSDITMYRFYGLGPHGTLKVQSWMVPRPTNIAALTLLQDGAVGMTNTDGTTSALRAP